MTGPARMDSAFDTLIEALKAAPPMTSLSPVQARSLWDLGVSTDRADVASVLDLAAEVSVGRVPCRLYIPEAPRALIVYFHGGGWMLGSLETADAAVRDLANDSSCAVLSVEYRLAPEHPFPAGLDDCTAVLSWAAARRKALLGSTLPLLVCGDSAGGNLAAAACLVARDQGGPDLALQVLIYPCLNGRQDTPSYSEQAAGGLLTSSDMAWFWDNYINDPASRDLPAASPLRAETLAGLPPALVVSAYFDPLRDDGPAYAERLRAAGVDAAVLAYDTLPHGFFTFGHMAAAARQANRAIASGIVRHLENLAVSS